ncbi:MAG: AbiV family abortive infection protein [Alphaproteobacteria bacterium]|nr:AbiV family abortive infection protein [Alphaproteobacteria bacterium]
MQRAIQSLGSLSSEGMLAATADGITRIHNHGRRLFGAAEKLTTNGDHLAAEILKNLAEEEIAKVLILVDAVRCPVRFQMERNRTLEYFYSHLAKGIYAEICNWRPINFSEVQRGIEDLRAGHYLDGPTGSDWIFPNQIERSREDKLYVDYVGDDSDSHAVRDCSWYTPTEVPWPFVTSAAIDIASALYAAGITTCGGLKIVARLWRSVEIAPEMTSHCLEELNWSTLEALNEVGLLKTDNNDILSTIRNRWQFPLWSLDLRKREVDKETLREIRRQWVPD